MKLTKLEIQGFRGISTGDISFRDFSILIGANNCGKTTVIEALALLLGRDRLVRSLTEHDFFGSNPAPADRIKIIATVSGFEPNDPAHHQNWFRMGRGVPMWLDVNTEQVNPDNRNDTDLLVCQIAFCARFDKATLEVETIRYFLDDAQQEDPFAEDANVTQLSITLIKELGFFLVPANRTWDRMFSFGSELFRRAVTYVGGKPAEAVIEERDRLRNPQTPLERDEKLGHLVADVNSDIKKLIGKDIELKLRLTSTDSDGVLEAVVPHFSEDDGVALPSRRHGSGLISLQTLILLMRFGALRITSGENFIMAIEEPELHVPPPQQRKLLHIIQQMATQTIITTHSPTVAAVPDPHELMLLVNKDGVLSARPLLPKKLDLEASSPQRGLFLSDREATVTAVMNPAVIIPEGKTDAGWLRLLARIADLTDGDSEVCFTHEVGVIPTKDARIIDVYTDLVSVHPNLTCLVDGDRAGKDYIKALSGLESPCQRIITWPDDWTIENIIAWIVAADETILNDPELQAAGLPNTAELLATELQIKGKKTDEVLHALLADAIAQNPQCCNRVLHLLNLLGVISTGRDVQEEAATVVKDKNGVTNIWTFSNAFPGI